MLVNRRWHACGRGAMLYAIKECPSKPWGILRRLLAGNISCDAADDVDGRHRREDVDPGVLVLMLSVPLVVGGAVVGSPVCRPGKQTDPPPAAAVEEARGSQV